MKRKCSSGDHRLQHPYVTKGVMLYGKEGWKTFKIKRSDKTNPASKIVSITIIEKTI
jgi:hypothetical protein